MFEGEDIAFNGLEVCSYRHLQGMAKKMGLPSNVKKVHLIEMIRAKKYCTETDLQAIVERVKMERKVNAQAKKKKPHRKPFGLQAAEISSTSNSQSPPITATPKHQADFIIQYSPDISQTIRKYQPKQNILCSGTSILQPLKRHIESDRVLRSYNSAKRPNYRIMEQNDCIDMVSRSSVQEIQELRQERAYQSVNVTVQKHRPVTATVLMNPERQLLPVARSCNITKPVKRQRKLSGIYPLKTQDKPIYEYVPTVGFRRTDGRVTKINAVIQKPLARTLLPKNSTIKISKKSLIPRNQLSKQIQNQALIPKRKTLTVQDMINYKVDHQSIDITKDRVETSNLYHKIDIEPQGTEIDRQIYSEKWIDERAIEENSEIYVSQTELYSVPSGQRNIDLNPTRKVYKGQRDKTARQWNYSIEYQDNKSESNKQDWNIYNMNEQSLDKADEQNKTNNLNMNEPISTNYEVTQSRITEPLSRDYQVEYQKFNQERTDRNLNVIDRYYKEIRNTDLDRSDLKDEGYIQETLHKNVEYARSDHNLNQVKTNRNMDHGIHQQTVTNKNINDKRTRDCTKTPDINYTTNRNHTERKESSSNMSKRSDIQNKRYIEIDRNMNNTKDQRYVIDMTDRNRSLTDMIRSDQKIDRSDQDLSSQYPNMSALTDVFPNEYTQVKESNYSVYYHKKIRAEHVKSRVREQLPRIADVFSQFNDVQYRNLSQPLYVHVSAESERVPTKLPANYINNTCMLETIYNFKNQFVTNPPVLMIATTQTHCTFSTKTVSTAVAQPPAAELCNNSNPYEQANPYQRDCSSRACDYLKPQFRPNPDFSCDEVLSSSTVSLETTNSQELGANVTIPEMVEDALELISQDGDYMERIGMDVRVQCILCDWAGPKIILEYHIKKEHSHEIQRETGTECSVLLALGELAAHTWRAHLLGRGPSLLVLSAKYTGDGLLLALSTIPTETESEIKRARITVYNKLTGQPYSYESDIKDLPDSMPYEYGLDCLNLDVNKLDLIPNSANLRLVNRELVGSPAQVVGQTELNNVEIVVYVKFID